jgi:fused signal recognition particle receptor
MWSVYLIPVVLGLAFFSKDKDKGEDEDEKPKKPGLFERFKKGLSKTRDLLNTDLGELLAARKPIRQIRGDLEEILIKSDLGLKTSVKLIDDLERKIKGEAELETVKNELRSEISRILKPLEKPIAVPPNAQKPYVILMLGVNGTGKTTTIGKLSLKLKNQGHKVLIAAADTFRAAAIEQLEAWAQRADVEIVKSQTGGDPAAVCFDAIEAGKSRNIDVVIIDTAGRLHTRANLMEELKKIKRVSEKSLGRKLDEVILVLDATTGQNATEQAKVFLKEMEVTGVIMTKLDGTAKGGIIVAIADQFSIPIRMVGVGEDIEDLTDFKAEEFAQALI